MEAINLSEKQKINAINITAYRAIKILKMLLEKPCVHQELIENLKQDEITSRSVSDDTLRATLNSLKAVGCEISRPCPANDYKYILHYHPFGLKLSEKQINILLQIRNDFLLKNDWKTVIEINDLYDKIAEMTMDEKIKDLFYHSKPFIKIKKEIIEYLKNGKLENKEVILHYFSSKQNQNTINIRVDNVFCYSGRLYIWAWYYKRKKYSYFNTEKIISVESIKPVLSRRNETFYSAKYKLFGEDCTTFKADEEENIIAKDEKSITIEYKVKSEFKFIQRLLSFGESFELLEPVHIKEILALKIKKMFERYNDD